MESATSHGILIHTRSEDEMDCVRMGYSDWLFGLMLVLGPWMDRGVFYCLDVDKRSWFIGTCQLWLSISIPSSVKGQCKYTIALEAS